MSTVAPGAVFGPFTVTADAPPKSGHRYVTVQCGCGALPRPVRAAWLPKGGVRCPACGATSAASLVQSTEPAQGNAAADAFERLAHMFQDLSEQVSQLHTLLSDHIADQAKPLTPAAEVTDLPYPTKDQFTPEAAIKLLKAKHGSLKAAHAANDARIAELAAVPFKERTDELKEELRQRWVVLTERMHMILPTDAGWPDLDALRRRGVRALEAWERDPAND